METTSLPISGMHCASCASIIKRTIEKIDGVTSCSVNYGTEKAEINYDAQKVTIPEMSKSIEKYGYSLQHEDVEPHHHEHTNHDSSGHNHNSPTTSDKASKQRKLEEVAHLKKKCSHYYANGVYKHHCHDVGNWLNSIKSISADVRYSYGIFPSPPPNLCDI